MINPDGGGYNYDEDSKQMNDLYDWSIKNYIIKYTENEYNNSILYHKKNGIKTLLPIKKIIKKIVFVNFFHNGDILMTQPIIKQFCENNNNYYIFYFTKCSSFLYNTIKKLKPYNDNFDHGFFMQGGKNVYKYDNKTLFINTWIGSWFNSDIYNINHVCTNTNPYSTIVYIYITYIYIT